MNQRCRCSPPLHHCSATPLFSDTDQNHLKFRKFQVSAGLVEYMEQFQKDLSVAGKFLTFGTEQGTSKIYLCLRSCFFFLFRSVKQHFLLTREQKKWRQIGFEGFWAGWKKNELQLCQERTSATPCSGFPSATADKSWFFPCSPRASPIPITPRSLQPPGPAAEGML